MQKKADFKKQYPELFKASETTIKYVALPPLKYLTIEGKGHPENNLSFEHKIGAMYGMAYTLKFMLKDPKLQPAGYYDFVIPPMGTRWWSKDMIFSDENRGDWCWQITLLTADFVSDELLNLARQEILRKKTDTQHLDELCLEIIEEENCAVMLHIGPYDTVGKTYAKMLEQIETDGRESYGKCHEIYMNDPRKTSPEKLKTIIRIQCR